MSADRPPLTLQQRNAAVLARQQRSTTPHGTPVPQRITDALNLAALYGPEVDRALGVEEPTVDRWEDPADPLLPNAEQVRALAILTGFPVPFFYRPVKVRVRGLWVCGDDGCSVLDAPAPPPDLSNVVPLRPRGTDSTGSPR